MFSQSAEKKARAFLFFSLFLLVLGISLLVTFTKHIPLITDFDSCVSAGNPVLESYPEQCRFSGKTFVRDIGNKLQKADLIRISSPSPGGKITSPFTLEGEARGNWYFEASFPLELRDSKGNVLLQTPVQARGEWMTEEFVPFSGTFEFLAPQTKMGTLLLKKDNPSGLLEHDDALIIPVSF
ncbi:MAG: Gmad2 immunoglobulin-like domain-containing protein [Patescibacteria group bacterium]